MNSTQLNELSCRDEWTNKLHIKTKPGSNQDTEYVLYPTGNCDLNGRDYVALPKDLRITDAVKRQYNLM